MDLIRLLLLEVEGEEPKPDLSAYSDEKQLYHLALMIEGGLVHGAVTLNQDGQPGSVDAKDLTWLGHDFLASARDVSVWRKATKKAGSAAFSVFLEVLKDLAKKQITGT